MASNITRQSVFLVAALAISIAGCGRDAEPTAGGAAAPGIITIDGSSTVFRITEAVAEEFQKAKPGARVTV